MFNQKEFEDELFEIVKEANLNRRMNFKTGKWEDVVYIEDNTIYEMTDKEYIEEYYNV